MTLLISSLSSFALGPLVGAFHVCRKGFVLVPSPVCRLVASMMRSVIVAHGWWDGKKFRYDFSHIISIASFLVLISRMSRPPLAIGVCRC